MLDNISVQDYFYLDNFLREQFSKSASLNLTYVHGLLTAVISAPTLIKPNEWTALIFGVEPKFSSINQAEKVMGLLIELYSQISRQLKGEAPYRLLLWSDNCLLEAEQCNQQVLKQWCEGYLMGTELDPLWCTDKSAVAMLTPFLVLACRHSFIGGKDSDGLKIEDDQNFIKQYRSLLADFVEDNYCYWQKEREEELAQRLIATKQQAASKYCPCGSRLFYSECCYEANATLH